MNPTGASHFNQARIEWAIRLRYSPMPELDMKYLAANLNAFRIGELRVVGKIWETMMERDGELACNAEKRESDLAGLEWSVVSDGSPDGDAHAAALTYFYDHLTATRAVDQDFTGGVSALLEQMAGAHSYYYSAHEMLLRVDNPSAKEVTAEFRHTPIWFFEARRGYLAYLPHIFDLYGQPCVEGEWLTVIGRGYMRPLCLAFATKMFSLRDWNTWCSRYASGFLVVKTPGSKGDSNWEAALEIMQALTNDGAALMSPNVTAEFLQQGARTGMPFKELADLVNSLYAKMYRGVDLATGARQGGSSAGMGGGSQNPVGASVQKEESGIFLTRDATWATGYLNARVDRPIIRYLFNQEPRAAIAVMPPQPDTVAEDLQSAQALVPLGLRIALKDAYQRFRWRIPEANESCLAAPVPTAPPGDSNDPDKPAAPAPAAAAAPVIDSPETEDKSQRPTQPAIDSQDKPIGAGADPKSLGKVQTANPNMPDPQVDAAGFWSSAGAAIKRAIFGPFSKNNVGQVPTAAYAIPNEKIEPTEEFQAKGREIYAAAVHADLSHAAAQLKALLQIDDPEHFKTKADQLLAKMDQIAGNTLLAPTAADALEKVVGTSYANGLQIGGGKALENWNPDEARDNLGRWVDPNGGGLSVRDNIKRGEKAVARGLNQKADVQKAMYRKEVGEIVFPYGRPGHTQPNAKGETHTDGYGLSHIAAKHADEMNSLPVTLAKGRIIPHPADPDKRLVIHGDNMAVLSASMEARAWAVTHYNNRDEIAKMEQKSRPSWMTGQIEGR